jgi:hypothetical protein
LSASRRSRPFAVLHGEVDAHARVRVDERGEQPREEVIAGADHGDRERAALDALEPRHRVLGLAELREDRGALRDELAAGGGQVDAPAEPLEQRQPGVALELADLRRDRGLRQVQLLGGARDRQVPRDGLEDLELAQRGVSHKQLVMSVQQT